MRLRSKATTRRRAREFVLNTYWKAPYVPSDDGKFSGEQLMALCSDIKKGEWERAMATLAYARIGSS
jgi:hypothetical protein